MHSASFWKPWPVRTRAAVSAGLTTGLAAGLAWWWIWSETSMWANYNHLIAAGLLASVLLVAMVAWHAAGQALRPVEAIRAELEDISANEITRRVPVARSSARLRAAVSAGLAAAFVLGTGASLLRHAVLSDLDFEFLIGVPIAALLVAAVAWWATGVALWPVEAIRIELDDITANKIRRRVPVPRSGDEITRLAVSTNATLDRLEGTIDRQRRFVADAAHELRSPLAGLRNGLEVAAAHPDRADWPQVVQAALNEVKRLHALTDDLLLLARLDRAAFPRNQIVDLAGLVEEQIAERAHLNPQGPRFTAHTEGPVHLAGSQNDLGRLLRNLLDNAARYARNTVTAVARRQPSAGVILEVHDDGPGIPARDRERVFERFARVDDARDRGAGGAGLGLAIVRDIAAGHGGTVHIADSEHGTRVVVRLPGMPSAGWNQGR